MEYTLNADGTVTIHHAVRFNDHVLTEFQAMLQSSSDIDITEEPELHEVMDAIGNRIKVAVKRKGNPTYEVLLTLGAVEAFAKEVAYYLWHATECRKECDGDRYAYADLTKTVNGCRTALQGANKVLTQSGLPEAHF
jgi:hypothetical protein